MTAVPLNTDFLLAPLGQASAKPTASAKKIYFVRSASALKNLTAAIREDWDSYKPERKEALQRWAYRSTEGPPKSRLARWRRFARNLIFLAGVLRNNQFDQFIEVHKSAVELADVILSQTENDQLKQIGFFDEIVGQIAGLNTVEDVEKAGFKVIDAAESYEYLSQL